MFTPEGFEPQTSAKWLIDEISKEAVLQGSPLTDWDKKVLASTVFEFGDNQRHLIQASHNLAVVLARSAIERAKEAGLPSIEVRSGLVVPQIWEDHYETVYENEFPWIVSLVMQNAFMGNPFVGETEPWMSPQPARRLPDVSKPKPDVSKPKPDVSKPKPDVSKPKSVSGKGVPTSTSLKKKPGWSLGEKIAFGVFLLVLSPIFLSLFFL